MNNVRKGKMLSYEGINKWLILCVMQLVIIFKEYQLICLFAL